MRLRGGEGAGVARRPRAGTAPAPMASEALPYARDVEGETVANGAYRRVVATTRDMQLVLMALRRGETIPRETHARGTQFFRIEDAGEPQGTVLGELRRWSPDARAGAPPAEVVRLVAGTGVVVPAGTPHEVVAFHDLKLYTIYAPPQHAPDAYQDRQPRRFA